MSNTKFTKSPWRASGNLPSRIYGFSRPDKEVLVAATGSVLGESNYNCYLISCAPETYELLENVKNELFHLIDEVNDQRLSLVNSTTLTHPDLHDGETLFLIEKLLAKARGEMENDND